MALYSVALGVGGGLVGGRQAGREIAQGSVTRRQMQDRGKPNRDSFTTLRWYFDALGCIYPDLETRDKQKGE